jgi:putative methyltransferase (TIGR04325 family)
MTDRPAPTWEGIYETFAEAGAEATVFEGTVWLDKIVARATSSLERSTGGRIPPVAVNTDYALPFVAALAASRGRPLRILDFGGGMATSYVPLRAMLPREQAIDFVVVENAAICDRGAQLFAADASVQFRTELPVAPERFDIVHFGSSLHYVDDWKGVLAGVTALEPEHLLFADLTAADNRSFVTTQRFHDRRIPVRFWNVDEFIGAVTALGYELLLKARYRGYYLAPDSELPTSNFDRDHRLTYTSQLVFRRARAITTRE